MKTITLLRHADTISREEFRVRGNKNDLLRPLSKLGKSQSKDIAHFVNHRLVFDTLISSPAKRTKQTLKPIEKKYKKAKILLSGDIVPDCGLEGYLKLTQTPTFKRAHHILIVGHQPDLESFAKYLCPHFNSAFPKGILIRFHLNNELNHESATQGLAGKGMIDFVLPPYLLRVKD